MAYNDYTKFNFIDSIGENLLISQLESNLKTYLDWSLLEIGSFTNIAIPTSGAFGGSYDSMRVVKDPSYTDGRVWETARKDWVWETGLTYATQPINITGVYISGTMYGTGSIASHHYNYPLGRVVFDNPIRTTSTVKISHSYRNVQVYIADQAPWWDELQYNSLRVDNSTFNYTASGDWNILANHRVQLPAVVIEAIPRRSFKPYEMGNVSNFVYQDVIFHVIAESRWWRNQLVDILSLQKDKTIWLYDNNAILAATGYPLDYRGMRKTNPLMYPTFVQDYRYKMARFFNANVIEMRSLNNRLKTGQVRVTFEIVVA